MSQFTPLHRRTLLKSASIGSALFASKAFAKPQAATTLEALKTWLAMTPKDRPSLDLQAFAIAPLSKEQAAIAAKLLWEDFVSTAKTERSEEWKGRAIKAANQEMKFDVRVFGEKPEGGRSMFISMHGGGGAPARVNDQQWENQKKLYKPDEGVYIAPRAPPILGTYGTKDTSIRSSSDSSPAQSSSKR